ncbi:MAG: hypothetical protein KatS3mg090_0036 [Patescibacteria group bacterium]|nr:MAG: hypothetical protein KatS3mg090_0036 [Patescibacteria group bacterium]
MFKEIKSKKLKTELRFYSLSDYANLAGVVLFCSVLFFLFAVFMVRLFNLTVVKGEYYSKLSEENRVRQIDLYALRGSIYDRKNFAITKSFVADKDETDKILSSDRSYIFNSAGHLVGYVGLPSESDLKQDNCLNPLGSEQLVGKMGVEKLFDCVLRGKNGKKLLEVNSLEEPQKVLAVEEPEKGYDIRLALDINLQTKVFEYLSSDDFYKDKKVAVVALKPKTAEILLYLSYPSFDPNAFSVNDKELVNFYLKDKSEPMLDRVANAVYPPGSVFKMLVAYSALQEKVVDKDTKIEDTGVVQLGPREYTNWLFTKYGRTDGLVDVVKALQRSNDIYFYKVGELLGWQKIRKYGLMFGLGKTSGFGLPEAKGLLPSDFWKREVVKERWFTGDTYNLSIGQGYLLTTPLQIANYVNVFANNGKYCRPLLLKTDQSFAGYPQWVKKILSEYATVSCNKIIDNQTNLETVIEGMIKACQPGGTGVPFFNYKTQVACKTGSAQSFTGQLAHSWFVVFAPVDDPQILLTVLVEKSGEGSEVAAPLAKTIIDMYYQETGLD